MARHRSYLLSLTLALIASSTVSADWFGGLRSDGRTARQSPATLFRWSHQPCVTGGPNLNEPLVTDRPDFTEASSTVGLGVAQIELGYTYFFDDDGTRKLSAHTYPESLLRVGILRDWLELRVAYTYVNETEGLIDRSGSVDLYLGFKLGLTPQDGIRPEMALLPQMFVPTGDSDFTSGNRVLGGLNWIYAWEINDFLSAGGSTQFNRFTDGETDDTFTLWAQSWVFGYSLTDRLGAYTEYFGLYPASADTALPENYFNGGFTVLVCNDMQWDVRGGVGLNENASDYFVGTGLSIRFH